MKQITLNKRYCKFGNLCDEMPANF